MDENSIRRLTFPIMWFKPKISIEGFDWCKYVKTHYDNEIVVQFFLRLGRACEKERTRGSAVFQAEHDSTQRTGTARTRLFAYSLTTWE